MDSGFSPPEEFRSLAVRQLLTRHGQLWAEHVSTEHTSIQFGVLLCLARSEDGLFQTDLAAQMSLDKATLTELVRRLASRGLVEVRRDAGDGRRRVATVTEAGLALVDQLHGPALHVNELLFAPLNAEEADQLAGLLARVVGD